MDNADGAQPASGSPVAAPPPSFDAAPTAAPGSSADPSTQCDPAADPGSADYKAGYQDGTGGKEQNGIPRDGAALAAYTEGYQAGQRDKSNRGRN